MNFLAYESNFTLLASGIVGTLEISGTAVCSETAVFRLPLALDISTTSEVSRGISLGPTPRALLLYNTKM